MTEKEKLLWMFEQVHGEMTGACSAEVVEDDNGEDYAVACMKNGQVCWRATKTDLMFDYLTLHLETDND